MLVSAALFVFVVANFFLFYSSGGGPAIEFDISEWNIQLPANLDLYDAISVENYAFASGSEASSNGHSIDIASENLHVSQFISYIKKTTGKSPGVYVVPGFVPPSREPVKLHGIAKMRLNIAVKHLQENPGSIILVSGGNVHPQGTPFNEAYEMKKYLIKVHHVPKFLVALEPNAQNTVTNLRNAGRFILAHGIKKATIITTLVQNLYISFPALTSFESRCQKLLGYSIGRLGNLGLQSSSFIPSVEVLQRAASDIDP